MDLFTGGFDAVNGIASGEAGMMVLSKNKKRSEKNE